MSTFAFCHRIAFASVVTLGGLALAPPAAAASTTAVTFQANNPWTQEVGSLNSFTLENEYTVDVAAGKTLQINLVTRNPNLYFKVKDETDDKHLADTIKTGAMTWSTPVTSTTNFRIRVYALEGTIPRGDTAKYALQIGRYGAADMRPASTAVTFQPGQPWAQAAGKLDAKGTAHDYTVAISAGNTLQVNLITKDGNVHFKVADPNQTALVDSATTGAKTWSTPVTAAGTYTVTVYADPKLMPPGKATGYALQIGQYSSTRTRPAAASTTMPPAARAAAPAAPASSASN